MIESRTKKRIDNEPLKNLSGLQRLVKKSKQIIENNRIENDDESIFDYNEPNQNNSFESEEQNDSNNIYDCPKTDIDEMIKYFSYEIEHKILNNQEIENSEKVFITVDRKINIEEPYKNLVERNKNMVELIDF